jgi:ABC-2 type transport system permease protein
LSLAVTAGICLPLFSIARAAQPPSAAEPATAEQQAEFEAQQPWVTEEIANCEAAHETGEGAENYPADCDEIRPSADWYLNVRPVDLVKDIKDGAMSVAGLAGLAALLIGVSFVGADWSAGVIGTQLLYEPRRGRVYAAKAIAVAGGAVAIGLVLIIVHALGIAAIASAWGTTGGFTDALGDLVPLWLRILGFAAAAGVVGLALVSAIRHSIAVLGVVIGYLIFGEGLLRSLWSGAESWLLSGRVAALIQGRLRIESYQSCSFNGPCEPKVIILHLGTSAAYLAVLTALAIAGSYLIFRRRDVA